MFNIFINNILGDVIGLLYPLSAQESSKIMLILIVVVKTSTAET